jgi:hypothetical protein
MCHKETLDKGTVIFFLKVINHFAILKALKIVRQLYIGQLLFKRNLNISIEKMTLTSLCDVAINAFIGGIPSAFLLR